MQCVYLCWGVGGAVGGGGGDPGKQGSWSRGLPWKPLYFPSPWLVPLVWASICYFCHYSTPQTWAQSQDTLTDKNKDPPIFSLCSQNASVVSLSSHLGPLHLSYLNTRSIVIILCFSCEWKHIRGTMNIWYCLVRNTCGLSAAQRFTPRACRYEQYHSNWINKKNVFN